jgi:hypothetical protein
MHKIIDWFQFFCTTKHAPFYENTCSLDERDEKPNHTKNLKFWKFEENG